MMIFLLSTTYKDGNKLPLHEYKLCIPGKPLFFLLLHIAFAGSTCHAVPASSEYHHR